MLSLYSVPRSDLEPVCIDEIVSEGDAVVKTEAYHIIIYNVDINGVLMLRNAEWVSIWGPCKAKSIMTDGTVKYLDIVSSQYRVNGGRVGFQNVNLELK